MLQTLTSKLSVFSFALVATSFLGCGGPAPEPTGTLVGTIQTGGEICDNCLVSIASTETLFRRGGNVDESGAFELTGIPFGDYQVRVVQMPTNLPENTFDKRIPKKYRDLKTSGLSASITSAEPVTLNIEME